MTPLAAGALVLQGDARSLPLPDASVDLIVTSPPYWALRSYRDGGEHYEGQVGSEGTPQAFLEALWAVTQECQRVLKPSGSLFVNLGDKYAGSGGHNNNGLGKSTLNGHGGTGTTRDRGVKATTATRRNAPDRYNQESDGIRTKSLLGLPWRYAIGVIDGQAGDPMILRAEIVWSKPNGLPESVTDRVRRSHEQWFHLVKSGRYFAAADEVREEHLDPVSIARHKDTGRGTQGWAGQSGQRNSYSGLGGNPLGKLPGSVWTVPSEPLIVPDWAREKYNLPDHFAAFPQEFPRRIILGWSPTGGVVLDPFSGTGTVAGVADRLGRVGIGVDLSMDYSRLATWRIEESGHFSKTEARTWRDRQGVLG